MKPQHNVFPRCRNRDHAKTICSAAFPVASLSALVSGPPPAPAKVVDLDLGRMGFARGSTQHSLGPGGSNGDTAYLGFSPSPDA